MSSGERCHCRVCRVKWQPAKPGAYFFFFTPPLPLLLYLNAISVSGFFTFTYSNFPAFSFFSLSTSVATEFHNIGFLSSSLEVHTSRIGYASLGERCSSMRMCGGVALSSFYRFPVLFSVESHVSKHYHSGTAVWGVL